MYLHCLQNMSKNSSTVAVQVKVQVIWLVKPFQFYIQSANNNIYTTSICKTTYNC